jgi:hypothetical protein
MPTDSVPQTTNSSYAGLPVTKAPNWHGLVAWDVLLNGLATGLFMVTGLCVLVDHAVFAPVGMVAFPVAWAVITADLVCLVLDLGDPLRFHHMLRVFKPSSPMSLGVWAVGGFGFFATVATFLYLLPIDNAVFDAARWVVFGIGFVLAMASAMYKGVLFSTTAQPVWRDGRWLGGYFTGTALVLGCAELLFLAIVLGNEPATHLLRHALTLLLGISLIPQALLLLDMRPALVRHFPRGTRLGFAAFVLIGGVVVPLGLLLVTGAPAALIVAIVLVLLANVVGRFAIVYIPHTFPRSLPEGG